MWITLVAAVNRHRLRWKLAVRSAQPHLNNRLVLAGDDIGYKSGQGHIFAKLGLEIALARRIRQYFDNYQGLSRCETVLCGSDPLDNHVRQANCHSRLDSTIRAVVDDPSRLIELPFNNDRKASCKCRMLECATAHVLYDPPFDEFLPVSLRC